jgi:predicted nucleotidyltransferase component of viral defense system
MPDAFFALAPADRRDALEVAAARSGRAVHLLEKDAWVVWALNALFESEFADHLVFKGGTSLSKAYQAIGRFSEDVDLTYDIRRSHLTWRRTALMRFPRLEARSSDGPRPFENA